MSAKGTGADSVAGNWHLLDAGADEQNIPHHRMDLRFEGEGAQFRAAILNRVTGEQIPLAGAFFDGSELRLQMHAPPGREPRDMPWLTMTRIDDTFEGHWRNVQGEMMGLRLKVVRAKA